MEIKKILNDKNNIIWLILFLNPLLDIIYTINSEYFSVNIPINQIVRIVITIYFFVGIREKISIKLIFFSTVILLFSEISSVLITGDVSVLKGDISYIIKLLYFLVSVLYIGEMVRKNKIKLDYILKGLALGILVICANLIISKFFNIGLKSYTDGIRGGVKGFFTVVNTVTAMMIISVPLLIFGFIKTRKKMYLVIYVVSCYSLFLIGTKFALATGVSLSGVFIIYLLYSVRNTIYRNYILVFVSIVFCIAVYFGVSYLKSFLDNQIQLFNNYGYSNFADFITSNRTLQIDYLNKYISNLSMFINPIYLFGLGFTNSNNIIHNGKADFQMLEMDFHGVLYYSGIFMFVIIMFIVIVSILRSVKMLFKNRDMSSFILLIALVFGTTHAALAGHVVYEAGPLLYYGTIIGIVNGIYLKENKSEKRLSSIVKKNKLISVFNRWLNNIIEIMFSIEDKILR